MSHPQPRNVFTWLLPALFEPEQLQGGTAVVIDILRATTVVSHALGNGAKCVVPCESVEAAKEAASQEDQALLGGERHGLKIEGFDLSNSPSDYSAEAVYDRTIVFTTTNGTRALARANQAESVLCGSFANLTAVLDVLAADTRPVHLVCAGTNGEVSNEDVLFAGAIVARLRERQPINASDASALAESYWNSVCNQPDGIHQTLRSAQGGRNLIELTYDADIKTCAQVDTVRHVPQLKNGRLT